LLDNLDDQGLAISIYRKILAVLYIYCLHRELRRFNGAITFPIPAIVDQSYWQLH